VVNLKYRNHQISKSHPERVVK